MKKPYILLPGVVALLLALQIVAVPLLAQTTNMPPFQSYPHAPLYSWENPYYESYQYQNPNIGSTYNLRFRLMKPVDWASSGEDEKFPLIVFFHGSGESASGDPTPGVQNNSLQLVHGGQRHRDAVINGSFPGFLLYPQMRRTGQNCGNGGNYNNSVCNNNNWGHEWREAVKYVIDKLIADYKVDPNRIYVHGLSGGGESTWQFMTNYPEYVAAAHPMSAAGNQFHATVESGYKEYYKHIPIWSSQGGTDGNPTPAEGNSIVTAIRDVGGSIRYSYYPSLGHDTWNSEYNKPDFFSWFLSKDKRQPHVFYEQPLACPGDPVNVRLGFSKTQYPNGRTGTPSPSRYRIVNYQWAKGTTANIVASGTTLNEIVIHSNPAQATNPNCTPGVYYGRFERANGGWSEWSDPIVVNDTRGPSETPVISSNGKSTILPTLEGSNEAILYGPSGHAAYQWKRGGVNISGADDLLYSAIQAGTYTLSSRAPAGDAFQLPGVPTEFRPATVGCFSDDSNPLVVTTANGLNSPAPPGNFFATTATLTSVNISWEDRSANETGFELYRSTQPGSGYELLTIIPASSGVNPLTYLDINLQPSTTYYYRMRAINNNGGSAYTPEVSANTVMDDTPPSAPVLLVGSTSRTVINLQWSGSTDNVGVTGYEIYQNGALIATTTGTSYAATSLVAFAQYNYVVKARDAAGNASPPSNQVNAAAVNSGLFYRYYHHSGVNNTTTQIETLGTLMATGTMPNFALTPRQRNDNFAFIYEGFINITTSGNYTFYTSSDDGSQLFINHNLVVNNDGAHGTQERSGSVSLSPGYYPIKVTFFENGGGEVLEVRYQGPGITKRLIPNSALSDTYTPPAALTAPNMFSASAQSYERIDISWRDNSSNETGFEISRATTTNGTYQVVHVAPAIAGTGTTGTWSDTGLPASTQYFYRIRAISANSQSSSVGPVNATTSAAPGVPDVPGNFVAAAVSPTQINLSWNNVAGEDGYTIQRSMNPASGFIDLVTVGANVTAYSNIDLLGNTTAYYRIRSTGPGGSFSNWSSVTSATTPNRAPVFTPTPDQTLVANQGAPQTINISVNDPDQDSIGFMFTGLPPGASFADNGYGQGVLTFTNVSGGTYNVQAQASDGVDATVDDFTLNVGGNRAPVISGLSVNGQAVTPTPIVGVQNQSTEAGRTLTMIFSVTDPDGIGQLNVNPITNGDIQNLPGFATPSWNGGSNPRTLTLTFNTTVANVGVYENITITFRDNQGGINAQTFSLIVNPVDLSYSIAINFIQESEDAEGAPWNNTPLPTPTSTALMSNLKDENGAVVKFVTFEIPDDWNIYDPGTFPSSPDAVYTAKVRMSHYAKNTGSSLPVGGNNKTFIFRNLNPALQYRVTGYAATAYHTTAGTTFRVTGSDLQILEGLPAYNNLTETRTSEWMHPNSSGQLQVNIRGIINNSFFYINSLILEASYIENAPPAAPGGIALVAPQNNRVDISWTDNSLNETEFRIYRSTIPDDPNPTLVGTVPTNIKVFTDNTATGRTTYYYRVKAYNSFGESAYSEAGIITTPNGAPVVENPGTVVVTAGTIVQTNISASDPEGDPLTLAGLNLPDFATLVDNGNGTGFIRFTPGLDDIGVYEVTVSATDNYTASAEAIFPLVISDPAVTETVYINFTATTAGNALPPWNNLSSASLPVTLKNSTGQNAGASGTMSINRSATNNNWLESSDNIGVNTGNNSGQYPDKVLQSAWVSQRIDNNNSATITLSGLTNSRRYNITILGSRDEFKFANSIYAVTTGGLQSGHPSTKTLNTRKNKSGIIRFTGIQPSGSQIVISVKRPNTDENNGAGPVILNHEAAVINAMVIEVYGSVNDLPAPKEFTATPVAPLQAASQRSILLTWSDDSWNNTGYQIERAEDPEGPFTLLTTKGANDVSHEDTGLPANKAYVYRIRAVRTSAPAAQSPWSLPVMTSTYDKVILVHISGPDLPTPAPWNRLAEIPANLGDYTMHNLMDINLDTTSHDLEVVDITTVGVRYDRGYTSATISYPTNVKLANYLYEANSTSSWRLRELDPYAAYDLAFFGTEWEGTGYLGYSRSRHNERVVTEYVVGQQRQAIYNAKNSELAYFRNLKPEAVDSTLTFDVNAYVGNDAVATAAFFNAIEIRSYTPLEAAFDKIAPSTPTNLAATSIAADSVWLTWTASTDNVGVTGYQIYNGTEMLAEVAGTEHFLGGLQPSTHYVFSVRARDLKGNWSGFSDPVEMTTLSADATAYYSKPGGDITKLSTWGPEENGSGTAPVAFTDPNQHFFLNRNAAIDSALSVVGINTRLIVTNGAELTINDVVTGVVDAEANASIVINAATVPQLGTLNPTSTVTFAVSSAIPGASYGHLVLDGPTANFSAGNYVIQGDLSLENNVSIMGAANNQTTLNVAGDVTSAGAQFPADDFLPKINFVSGATQTLSLDSASFRLSHIGVTDSSSVEVVTESPTTIRVGTSTGGGLTIAAGSTFTLGENNLEVRQAGAINATNEKGELAVSKSVISILSSGEQLSNLYFKVGEDTVKALRVNANASAQVTVRSRMYVNEELDVQSGRVNAEGNISLVSTDTHSARIPKIGSSGSIIGGVEFQRYMNALRVYRYMAAPVYNTRVMDWQASLQITGTFQGGTGSPSVYHYDEPNGGWVAFPGPAGSTSSTFDVGRGYSVYQFDGATPNKLAITGPIHQGDFTYTNLAPGTGGDNGWNLLGNVYASPIKWKVDGWLKQNISGTVSVRRNTGSGAGGFRVWNAETEVGDSDFEGVIAQGQAFWVQALTSAPSITITEDAKENVGDASFFRSRGPVNQLMISLKSGQIKDNTFIHFAEESIDAVEGRFDALKRANEYFNLSTMVDSRPLAINSMSFDFCQRRIPLNITNAVTGSYSLAFTQVGLFDFEPEMMLVDHLTANELVVTDGFQYSFNITTDPASYGANRFELIIRKAPVDSNTLFQLSTDTYCNSADTPIVTIANSQKGVRYHLMSMSDTVQTLIGTGGNIQALLNVAQLPNAAHNVQILARNVGCETVTLAHTESINVVNKPVVVLVDGVLTSGITGGSVQWYKDGEPIPGATDTTLEPRGSSNYSVEVTTASCSVRSDGFDYLVTGAEDNWYDDASVLLYPNPVEKILTVVLQKTQRGTARIAVHSTMGQVVMRKNVAAERGPTSLDVEGLSAGLYTITLELPDRTVQKRFVKK